ncbi:hypothetical protein [Streptomyces maremycinicus]|uniref:hypothetical protein n=1 Tax=Streptomyces maremycinicus TaxID=1679753 RepID=UPI0007886491|nr:hypothetical protein [Streptomyces sp. NBRC 110468]
MPTRPTPPPRRRVRPLAVALTAAAALTLTACHDGQGLRDEGPSSSSTLTGSGPHQGSGHDSGSGPRYGNGSVNGSYGVAEAPARSHAEPPSGNS